VKKIGMLAISQGIEFDRRHFSPAEIVSLRKGQSHYQDLCFACHGYTGTGMPLAGGDPNATQAPPLGGAREVIEHRDAVIKVLLNGLTGPVHGKTYVAQMVPMDTNADKWIAEVGSFVRNAFGNHGEMITPAEVAALRAQAKTRGKPWTIEELNRSFPQPVANRNDWKVTANPNPAAARLCIDGDPKTRWSSNQDLAPGMWVQIELPQRYRIAGVMMDTSESPNDYARAYKIQLSDDGVTWDNPVAHGKGHPGAMEISFPPAEAKFVRITQTGELAPDKGLYWSIHELEILQPAAQ
jgi:mono/diheme cytochrome c family protein